MRRWGRVAPALIMVSAVVAAIVIIMEIDSPLRPIIVWGFLGVCPGMALVGLLGFRDPLIVWTLAIATSLALDTLVPMAMLYLGLWSVKGNFMLLVAIAIAGAALQFLSTAVKGPLQPQCDAIKASEQS